MISLIIGTYNRGAKIADTLQSVLNQERPADEVLVVDDGSSDDTAEFVRSEFPSVRVLSKVNGGTSSARNHGAAHAKGEWLVFLDHDDLLLSNAIGELERLSQSWSDVSAGYCDHQLHDCTKGSIHNDHHKTFPQFQRLFEIPLIDQKEGIRLYGRDLFTTMLRGNLLQQPWIVRASEFRKLGGFDESIRYCEDWDMYLRITRGRKVAMSDEVVSIHRIEGQNLHLEDWVKQYDMYEKTLIKQYKMPEALSWEEKSTISSKMAEIQKRRGDRFCSQHEIRQAWKCYFQSARWKPTDPVVLARLGLWFPGFILERNKLG